MCVVGVGVDLVDAVRIARLTEGREDIFRARILGRIERDEIRNDSGKRERDIAYACSVAAKEACLKALGTGLADGARWPDVQIEQRNSARPHLLVSGEPQKRMAGLGVDSIHLSLSIVKKHALAIVLLTRNSDGIETQ